MTEQRLFAALYTDEDITGHLAVVLRQRGFDVVAAHEVNLISIDDQIHLAYAAKHQRILLTCNRDDFIRLAHQWATAGQQHHGIVICPQFSRHQFGELLRFVLNLLNRTAADDLMNTVCYLTAYR
jgi:predicted nuclease of predicted toxin-antitoxin system